MLKQNLNHLAQPQKISCNIGTPLLCESLQSHYFLGLFLNALQNKNTPQITLLQRVLHKANSPEVLKLLSIGSDDDVLQNSKEL